MVVVTKREVLTDLRLHIASAIMLQRASNKPTPQIARAIAPGTLSLLSTRELTPRIAATVGDYDWKKTTGKKTTGTLTRPSKNQSDKQEVRKAPYGNH